MPASKYEKNFKRWKKLMKIAEKKRREFEKAQAAQKKAFKKHLGSMNKK